MYILSGHVSAYIFIYIGLSVAGEGPHAMRKCKAAHLKCKGHK